MNLQGIVAVSGKPGLWRALAQNKTGYILESLDASKTKLVANLSTAKIAALHEITIFGESEDIKLLDVFERIKNASDIPDPKADGRKLREFFREVAPDHDEEKVYASDMKKVIVWYHLLKDFPFFNEAEEVAPVAEIVPVEEEITVPEGAQVAEEILGKVETPVEEDVKVAADVTTTAEKVEETKPETVPAKPKTKKPTAKKTE